MCLGQPNDPKNFHNVKRKTLRPLPAFREFPFLLGHLGQKKNNGPNDPNDPMAGRPRGRRPGAHGRAHATASA